MPQGPLTRSPPGTEPWAARFPLERERIRPKLQTCSVASQALRGAVATCLRPEATPFALEQRSRHLSVSHLR